MPRYYLTTGSPSESKGATFDGEELGRVSQQRNIRRADGVWRRTWTWTCFRLAQGGKILLHRQIVELGSGHWEGSCQIYEQLPDLLTEIHVIYGRSQHPLVDLRRELLTKSLAPSPRAEH